MLIIFFLLLFTPCLADETFTITTYYPSPYGSYNELRSKKMAIGETYIDNAVVSWDSPCLLLGGNCTSNDTALIVEGKVGIGTANPTASLEINGQIKITGGNPGSGRMLTSDASGLASWVSGAVGRGTPVAHAYSVDYQPGCGGSPNYFSSADCSGSGMSGGQLIGEEVWDPLGVMGNSVFVAQSAFNLGPSCTCSNFSPPITFRYGCDSPEYSFVAPNRNHVTGIASWKELWCVKSG